MKGARREEWQSFHSLHPSVTSRRFGVSGWILGLCISQNYDVQPPVTTLLWAWSECVADSCFWKTLEAVSELLRGLARKWRLHAVYTGGPLIKALNVNHEHIKYFNLIFTFSPCTLMTFIFKIPTRTQLTNWAWLAIVVCLWSFKIIVYELVF